MFPYAEDGRSLRLNIEQGRSLGPFAIGMEIQSVVQVLRAAHALVRNVTLQFRSHKDGDTGAHEDIVLDVTHLCVKLYFEQRSQRLRLIEVYRLSKPTPPVELWWLDHCFMSPNTRASFLTIQNCFDFCLPGSFDALTRVFTLNSPGLQFTFDIPPEFAHQYETPKNGQPFPSKLANGTSPSATSVRIFYTHESVALLPDLVPRPNNYFEPVRAVVGHGLFFSWRREWLRLNCSVQEAVSILGLPHRYYFPPAVRRRGVDALAGDVGPAAPPGTVDVFLNYFHLGIDLMYRTDTHRVCKIVLHTNFPSDYEFTVYNRCNFVLLLDLPKAPVAAVVEEKKDLLRELIDGEKATAPAPRQSERDILRAREEAAEKLGRLMGDPGFLSYSPGDRFNSVAISAATAAATTATAAAATTAAVAGPSKQQRAKNKKQGAAEAAAAPAVAEEAANVPHEQLLMIDPVMSQWDAAYTVCQRIFGANQHLRPLVSGKGTNSQPFGQDQFYGFDQGVVFEVLPNRRIASVCLAAPIL
jgi:hypothetical protein